MSKAYLVWELEDDGECGTHLILSGWRSKKSADHEALRLTEKRDREVSRLRQFMENHQMDDVDWPKWANEASRLSNCSYTIETIALRGDRT